MNRIIILSPPSQQNLITVNDPLIVSHLKNHLNIEIGKKLKVTILNQGLTQAEVLEINEQSIILKAGEKLKLGALRYIDLFIGLSRPPSLKKIIEHTVGLPIKTITFYQADLSEKSFANSKVLQLESLEKLLITGLSQAGNYHDLPSIQVSSLSLDRCKFPEKCFFLDHKQNKTFKDFTLTPDQIALIIGPERGFSPKEYQWLESSRCQGVKISSGIQRVEIATFVASGQIEMLVSS